MLTTAEGFGDAAGSRVLGPAGALIDGYDTPGRLGHYLRVLGSDGWGCTQNEWGKLTSGVNAVNEVTMEVEYTMCFGRRPTIAAEPGSMTVGTRGNDGIIGTSGRDTIDGRGGNDRICSLGGNGVVSGDAGNDSIRGGRGRDTLRGGAGRDLLDGGPGRDTCDGGAGNNELLSC